MSMADDALQQTRRHIADACQKLALRVPDHVLKQKYIVGCLLELRTIVAIMDLFAQSQADTKTAPPPA